MLNALSTPKRFQHVCLPGRAAAGKENGNIAAGYFRRRISVHTLRSRIPSQNEASQVRADDGVFGGIDNRRELQTRLLILLALGCVDADADHANRLLRALVVDDAAL